MGGVEGGLSSGWIVVILFGRKVDGWIANPLDWWVDSGYGRCID